MGIIRELGISTCGQKDITQKGFDKFADNGIKALELSFSMDNTNRLNWKNIRKYSDDAGVRLWSLHLPFCPFEIIDISSSDPGIRKSTVEYESEIIRMAADIGIGCMVIHASGEPIDDDERSERMKHAKESFASLAAVAAEAGALIAVEDLPRTCLGNCSADILDFLKIDDRLRVCFDTNHLLNEKINDFMMAVGDKIHTLHISDYDFINERHWLPGEGKINWQEFMTLLDGIKYNNPFIYEISYESPNTIMRKKNLSLPDFERNFSELNNGRPLTAPGIPKENLGMWL